MKTFKKRTEAPLHEDEEILGGPTDRKTLEARVKRFKELFKDLDEMGNPKGGGRK